MKQTSHETHLRVPPNYRLVLDVVEAFGHGVHHNANEIFIAARAHRPSIGFSTVYRALIRLRDLGLVSEILIPGAPSAVYETAAPEHAHFRCVTCGSVRDLEYQLPATLVSRVEAAEHAHISSVSLAFHGVCAACSS